MIRSHGLPGGIVGLGVGAGVDRGSPEIAQTTHVVNEADAIG